MQRNILCKTKKHDEIYSDFKLIKSNDIKFKDAYNILASMHNKTPNAISHIILNNRIHDEKAHFIYHCSKERKTMSKSDYYAFLNVRDNQIYNEVVEYGNQNPSISKTDIFKIISPKFNISVDRVAKIYYKVKKNVSPPDPNETKTICAQHKDILYDLVINMLYKNPDFTKNKAIHTVAKDLNIATKTAELLFYDYQKFMRQERNRESEPTDEVV